LRASDIDSDDIGTVRRVLDRNRPANSARGACDDRNAPLKL
jgi:hypothetical protein